MKKLKLNNKLQPYQFYWRFVSTEFVLCADRPLFFKKMQLICKVCKKEFYSKPSEMKKGRKYCSYKCYWKSLKESIPWNKGTKGMCKVNSGSFKKGQFADEKHWDWKGDQVRYRALHAWIENKLGKPDVCKFCGKSKLKGRRIHWANSNKKYKRNLTDWLRLCVRCHKAYDKGLVTV